MDVAFEDLVRVQYEPLRRAAFALCGDRQQAEDLVQTAFVRAHRQSGRVLAADDPAAVDSRGSGVGPDGQSFVALRSGRLHANNNLADTWIEARDTDGNLLLSRQLPYPLPGLGGTCP